MAQIRSLHMLDLTRGRFMVGLDETVFVFGMVLLILLLGWAVQFFLLMRLYRPCNMIYLFKWPEY